MKARTAILIGLALLLIPLFHLEAQIPGTLSYQAFLSDSLGVPKADGTYIITFGLYDVETGGTALWTETKDDLYVKQGLFYTHLGPFPASLRFDQPYWLGIQVGSETELTPRIPLTSVGYSFRALRSDTAQYAIRADTAQYALLADSAQYATRADTAKVATSALAAADLADNAVTSEKIADGTIQREDVLADFKAPYADTSGYADTSDYALSAPPGGSAGGDLTGTYPNPTIAPDAVNSEKILDGTITGADISTSAAVNIASLNLSGDASVGGTLTASALDVNGTVTATALDLSGSASVGGSLTITGGQVVNVDSVITQTYTTTTSDRIILCSLDPQYEFLEVTLHSAASAPGQLLSIKTKNIYVDILPSGEETIDGMNSIGLDTYNVSGVTLVSDGENWWIISTVESFWVER